MRLRTIFIIIITILLTVVIMQNNESVYFNVLFFTAHTSKLVMMLVVAVIAFIIGYLTGRPKRTKFNNNIGRSYDEHNDTMHEGTTKPNTDTLSDEDREYIS